MNPMSNVARSERSDAATVTVIVPVLNEAANLLSSLPPVLAMGHDIEVIVVDAGSSDGSTDLARGLGAKVLVSSISQRAAQMNLGAQAATGEVLVFLHADTVLPADWLGSLRRELFRRPEAVGGVFRRRFQQTSIFLRLTCRLADWRAQRFGWFLGDQTIFARRKVFSALGGYRPMNAFEDLDFSMRLKNTGPTFILPAVTLSSGRRFIAKGPFLQTLADLRLTARFLCDREAFEVGRLTHDPR
jgi:rSAM/selenodomain-associated transferase 2